MQRKWQSDTDTRVSSVRGRACSPLSQASSFLEGLLWGVPLKRPLSAKVFAKAFRSGYIVVIFFDKVKHLWI